MNEVDQAKLLAALLGVLKKENSKTKKALGEELSQELQKLIDDQSGTQYLQIDELEQPVPVQVFRGEKGDKGHKGTKGLKGNKGDKGSRGLSGPEGPQGVPGQIGPMGPQGLTGPTGDKGLQGEPGKDGETPNIEPFKSKISKDFEEFARNISSQITRMAYAGGTGGAGAPGSGEVRLLRLDDVDPDNLGDKHYLRYNSDTEKLEFTNVLTSDTVLPSQIVSNTINVSVFKNDSNYASRGYVTQAIANLVYTAPEALDTIWELAAAINDNPNFGAQILTSLSLKANTADVRTSLSLKANTADLSTVAFSGSYGDLLNLPNLDQYLTVSNSSVFALSTDLDNYVTVANSNIFATKSETLAANNALIARMDRYIEVANASLLIQDKVDKYLQVANTGSLVLRPELDKYLEVANVNFVVSSALDDYLQIANANVLIQDKVDKYLEVSNTGPLVLRPELDQYIQVANANVLIQDKVDKYLEVSNTGPLVLRPELDSYIQVANATFLIQDKVDKYLEVANTGALVQRYELDKYLEVANANFTTQADLDHYLQVANANSVSPDELSLYLQVANAEPLIQDKVDKYLQVSNTGPLVLRPELDRYLQVANAEPLIQDKVDKYLEVSNTGPLVLRPELDKYIHVANANVLIQDKVDKYLQVANTGALVQRYELDNYLQVSNVNFTTQSDLDKYLQVSNVNFITQDTLDRYLEVANASSVSPDQLTQYLQVANAEPLIQDKVDKYLEVANTGPLVLRPELDDYLHVANANVIIQDKVDKYLQVSNTGAYVIRSELDNYLEVANSNFVTQDTLDNYLQVANNTSIANTITVGSPSDGSWTTDGAYQGFSNTQTVTDVLDDFNEVIENVRNDTFVKSISFTGTPLAGGAGFTTTLALSTEGNPNRYDIYWGDGANTIGTTDTTPSHTYNTNVGSPFSIRVVAYNNGGAGSGSQAESSRTDYVIVYTADPTAGLEVYGANTGGSQISYVDDGSAVYLENTSTEIGPATIEYRITWGDSSNNVIITDDTADGGSAGNRLKHIFDTATETEQSFTVSMNLDSHNTANPSVIPISASPVTIKVYDTHTPEVSLNANSGINEQSTSGYVVTATNNTENTIGSYASYGIQYLWTWGDGSTDTVNVGSGGDGDTGGDISHVYSLSSTDQANGNSVDYTGNLRVMSNHSASPFISTNFTVHVEPDVRATISGSSNTSNQKASNDNTRTLYKQADLSGANRAIATVTNTTQNGDSYSYVWGDGNDDSVIENGIAAGSTGAAITHNYQSASVGNYALTMTANGTPDITAQQDSDSVTFTLKNIPAAPSGLSSKSLTLSTAAQDTSKLASGFVDFAGGGLSAGDSLNTSTARRYDTTTSISTSLVSNVYDSTTGTLSAVWNSGTDGSKTFTLSTSETGTFTSLVVTSEGDAYNELSTTYPQNYYQVFTARIDKNLSGEATGVHRAKLSHTSTGDTNEVYIVKDSLSVAPTLDISSATLEEDTAGAYRYISGVPYYNTGSPKVRLVGATVDNFIGQAYLDSTNIARIQSGTNDEGTSTSAVTSNYRSYSDIDGSSSMLSSGIPVANTGVDSSYALGSIVADITSSSINTVETIGFNIQNVNGVSSTVNPSTKVQVHRISPTFDEGDISVANDLGSTFDTNGTRITGLSGLSSFSGSTDYYVDNEWSGAETVAGTNEAIVRLNTLKHFTTDLSSGYLPAGPDLSAGRSGAQYFTFALKRSLVANFVVRLTGTVSGLFIAAPGTAIDSASGNNGWLNASVQYAGAGVPGSDTGNGGNGSDGCASTAADKIVDGTSYSNKAFTLTLGSENLSNAHNNQLLVSVKLESGDSLTAISIEAP